MKNHWLVKLIALVLAMASGALLLFGGAGILLSEESGAVEGNIYQYNYAEVRAFCEDAASYAAGTYAQKLSGTSEEFFRQYIFWDYPTLDSLEYAFDYRIVDADGRTLENTRGASTNYDWEDQEKIWIAHSNTVKMPELSWYPEYDEYSGYYAEGDVEFPALTPGTYAYAYGFENGERYRIDYVYTDEYVVEVCLTGETVQALSVYELEIGDLVLRFREYPFQTYATMAVLGGMLLAVSLVWLCAMAGKNPGSGEIKPGYLNAMPLDVYALLLAGAAVLLLLLTNWLVKEALYITKTNIWPWKVLLLMDGSLCGLGLALAGMAVTAQVRAGEGFWWKNTVIGRCWGGISRFFGKMFRKILGWCGVAVNSMGDLFPPMGRMLRETVDKIPLIWQWVLAYGGLFLLTLWVAATFRQHFGWGFLIIALCGFPIVVYSAYCFARLRDAAHKMAQGRLDAKVGIGNELHGCFREFGEDLNQLSDVCVEAAREQLKSERMKTELITNVSHDIKTPLTSIINYVDLLQRTEDEAERQQYLEVLERQSLQLKKLIEDLMEMSKASSGNLTMELGENDVTESVHQALGEFADRLESRNLQVVFRAPESLMAKCDGRLLWRVLSNLLGNVVKYALPGTRVYLDVAERADRVEISVKNISAEPLNISADELMERFVRGDVSRNTEGNGLGLNIARSLMEAQGGTLELVVDGDLFKVVLTLPRCS